jgi:hypothetical protein
MPSMMALQVYKIGTMISKEIQGPKMAANYRGQFTNSKDFLIKGDMEIRSTSSGDEVLRVFWCILTPS